MKGRLKVLPIQRNWPENHGRSEGKVRARIQEETETGKGECGEWEEKERQTDGQTTTTTKRKEKKKEGKQGWRREERGVECGMDGRRLCV